MKNFGLFNLRLFIVSSLVVCVLVCLAGFAVRGQEEGVCSKERFYREQEQKLLKETRGELARMGFVGSGVTLNRVVERDVERVYTFTIHHSRIDAMEPTERQKLAEELEALTEQFPCAAQEDTCEFRFTFLIL